MEKRDYLQSLRGFDPKRDYAKYAQPAAQTGLPAGNSYGYDERNYEYQKEIGSELPDPRQPDINLMNRLYDTLAAAEKKGITTGEFEGVSLDGAREILSNELYKVEQDYQRRLQANSPETIRRTVRP